MIRTFQALTQVQPGFTRPEDVQTLRISIPESQVKDPVMAIRMEQDISQDGSQRESGSRFTLSGKEESSSACGQAPFFRTSHETDWSAALPVFINSAPSVSSDNASSTARGVQGG